MSLLKHVWFAAAVVVAALPATTLPILAGEATSPTPNAGQIDAWIRALDSEDYAAREAAGKSLVAAGRAAIEPVAKAILSDSPETAWRANDVLEQIGLSGDEQTLELVSKTLAEISKSSKHSLARSTSDVQRRWKLMRHERAVEQITKLGGHVHGGGGGDVVFIGGGMMFGGGMMPPPIAVDFGGPILIDGPLPAPKEDAPAEAEPAPEPGADDAKPADEEIKDIDEKILERLKGVRIEVKPEGGVPRPVPLLLDPELPAAIEVIGEEKPAEPAEPAAGGFFDELIRGLGGLLPFGAPEPVEPPVLADDVDVAVEAVDFAVAEEVILLGGMGMAMDFDIAGSVWGEGGGAHMVRLDKKWTGGVEGFKLLKDVIQLNMLELHELEITSTHLDEIKVLAELRQLSLQRCRFDRSALAKLKEARPELNVLAFGEALLGISGDAHPEGFQVSMVNPGSGAEAAGLQVGDVITTIAGEELRTFERLTHIIASHTTGDKLKIEFQRGGKKQTVEAKLGAREAAQ